MKKAKYVCTAFKPKSTCNINIFKWAKESKKGRYTIYSHVSFSSLQLKCCQDNTNTMSSQLVLFMYSTGHS